MRLAVILEETPLHARGEAGATAPAQPTVLHERDDFFRRHRQRLLESLPATSFAPARDRARGRIAEVLAHDANFFVVLVWISHYDIRICEYANMRICDEPSLRE